MTVHVSDWDMLYSVNACCVCMLQNMFDLTLSQALGVSSKKESGIATSSKLNKVAFHFFLRRLALEEERMRPGHLLGRAMWVFFSDLALFNLVTRRSCGR